MVLNFRGKLQCKMGGKREGPIESEPMFRNLNPLQKQTRQVLKIPTWTEALDLTIREMEMIPERDVPPATLPEFPPVRQMTLGMNN